MNILDRHRRLRDIGQALLQGNPISGEDRLFLSNALIKIGNGSDAADELDTKPRAEEGERSYETARKKDIRDKLMYAWLEAAMAPEEEGGLGLTRKKAIKRLKNTEAGRINFPISEETINSYLTRYPEKRNLEFTID